MLGWFGLVELGSGFKLIRVWAREVEWSKLFGPRCVWCFGPRMGLDRGQAQRPFKHR